MNLSAYSQEIFNKNLDLLKRAWEVLYALQENATFSSLTEHPLGSEKELYDVYHEYLWILERLYHPKDKRFFKTSFIPINGYLDGYLQFRGEEVRFFKADYFPSSVGEDDWKVISLARNRDELNEMLEPDFDFKEKMKWVYFEAMDEGAEVQIESLITNLHSNEIARVTTGSDLQQGDIIPSYFVDGDKMMITGVSGMAHVLLPETSHQITVLNYWCEHFDNIYQFLLEEETVIHLVHNLNQLSYLNQFLGVKSEKSYRFTWQTEEFGDVMVWYQNLSFVIESRSQGLVAQLIERFEKLTG